MNIVYVVYVQGYGCDVDGSAADRFLRNLRTLGHNVHCPPLARQRNYTAIDGGQYPSSLWSMAMGICAYLQDNNLRDVTLIGHSMGSVVAAIVTAQCRERISQLIIVCPSSTYDMSLGTMARRTIINTTKDYWRAYRPWRHPHKQSLRRFLKGARGYVGWRPWELRRAWQEARALTTALLPQLVREITEWNIPVGVFYGECDELFEARRIATAMATTDVKLVRVPSGIHNLPQHQSDLLLACLQAYNFLPSAPGKN